MGREIVVILVAGRSALARLGGVPSVARYVAAASRLGLEPIVIYPAGMRALGAEVASHLHFDVRCIAAEDLGSQLGDDDAIVLLLAADWYLSFRAVEAFRQSGRGPALARVTQRGLVSVPMARLRVRTVKAIALQLATAPVGASILETAAPEDPVFEIEGSDQHRLSDNISVAHAEDKLFSRILGPGSGWWPEGWKRTLAISLVRAVAPGSITPRQLSVAKIVAGLFAALMLARPGYLTGVFAASILFGSRVLDGAAAALARARLADSAGRSQLDLVGDVGVLVAVLWGAAARVAWPQGTSEPAHALALFASLGVLLGGVVVYALVLREFWATGGYVPSRERPIPRFAHRDGAAYALLLTALLGRVDLFLWAAAIASHLFWATWLLGHLRAWQAPAGSASR